MNANAGEAACAEPLTALLARDGAPPWAPSRHGRVGTVDEAIAGTSAFWGLREMDIFADLSEVELTEMSRMTPMRTVAPGELLYSPTSPTSALFMLKAGRVRVFRLSSDGRALTTAIVDPGTVFGEMPSVGQSMHNSFAEAMDSVTVCSMGSADVERLLLSDARVAARIAALLGGRLAQLEQRLADTVFKTGRARVASVLAALEDSAFRRRSLGREPIIRLTHEQIAALAGMTREATTRALGDLASEGLLTLGRGTVTVRDAAALRAAADDA